MRFSLLFGLLLAAGESCIATTTSTSKLTTTTKHTSTTSTKTTKSTSTTTTTSNIDGPSVSSCGGPQLYDLVVHRKDNGSYIGNVYAELADGGEFVIEVSPQPYDAGAYYVTQYYRSHAPADHGDFIGHTQPNPEYGLGSQVYYLGLGGQESGSPNDTRIVNIAYSGQKLQCSVAKYTELLNCTVPDYGDRYEFAVVDVDPSHPNTSFYYLYFVPKDVVPNGYIPVNIAAKKGC